MSAAVSAALAGIDPIFYLENEDPVMTLVMAALTEKYFKEQEKLDENRAQMIANAVAKTIKIG